MSIKHKTKKILQRKSAFASGWRITIDGNKQIQKNKVNCINSALLQG